MASRNYNDRQFGGVEALTGYSAVIQSDHAYIHQGIAYTLNIVQDIAIGATYALYFYTPDPSLKRFIHMRPTRIASSASGIVYKLEENCNYNGGTDLTNMIWNRNRTVATTLPTYCEVKGGVTSGDDGTILESCYIGAGGSRRNSEGGENNAQEELLLAPDTDYILQFENTGGKATTLSLTLFWYETKGYYTPAN